LQKCQKSAIIRALAYLDIPGYFVITVMILSDTEIIMTINKVRAELANTKAEIIKWLFIFLIGQGPTIISILKFIK